MEFSVQTANPAKAETPCLLVPVYKGGDFLPTVAKLDDASERLIGQLLERGDFDAALGNVQLVPFAPGLGAERILLVGLGEREKCQEAAFIKALDAAMTALVKLPIDEASVVFGDVPLTDRDAAWKARKVMEAAERAIYRFDQFKSSPTPTPSLAKLTLIITDADAVPQAKQGALVGNAIGQGINYTRTLGNLPGNVCTPSYLAEQAEQLGRDSQGALEVDILDEEALEALGAGSLLSVGRGSKEPTRLIVMKYQGAEESEEAPHVLVGKGITFDTGGISLKPGESMDEMKFDMCGAASVFGTVKAVLAIKPKLNLVFIVAAAENMPDGNATKPGDIIKTLKGLTVEVLNTDAEGRLVLCDALTYAERFTPASVVDIATLTGAVIIGLGHHATGLLSNDDDLALDLLDAGEAAWDRAWHLPLWDEYQEQLESNFADLANIGGRPAGTITAACFLSRFADHFPWAHLDIAGTAWHSGKQKGATGRPVGLLTQYLLDREADAQVENSDV
ncbi:MULTISPECIES: leucyl aminopeptidase [Halomonadaceae]|jgi:leucyl aminopeptidase|uniref:leucyl aminopeptidase n=1 Tax=Halomonadaceae TaxID=28256 RepID=UPI0012F336ED|nr:MULTISPECIES: leucyl aminopeptidase [Halomonas]QNU63024.1 leucyl aminopeptidase [Halomonas titanicae]CAD5249851.1 aminopeptidase A, a cyteinylglycinase [Halomonas sp. I3]CAD5272385.1 aminopeptidase A, a cyteinylglycinase [Halomonas sp. 113]CAD5274159.1 aminopeptidase A, a cyteinylglycinase [Halomonas sp. 59]CAD5279436.1 aminopeptidase A, a cyteinylglycinase [Halomonas sp. 156]